MSKIRSSAMAFKDGVSKARLDYLDSIRGIAALVVVLGHCWLATAPASLSSHGSLSTTVASSVTGVLFYGLAKFFESGRTAVMIFFVLSGFVLTCSLLARPMPYVSYAVKRVFRIYPAFLIVILASYCLHYFIGVRHDTGTEYLKYVSNPNLSFIVLIEHLAMVGTKETMSLDNVMWTLVHEIRISLIFPAILLSVMKYKWRAVLLYLAISVACTEWLLFTTGRVARGTDDETFVTTIFETGYLVVFFACGAYLAIARQKVSFQIASLPLWGKTLLFAATFYFLLKSDYDRHGMTGCVADYLRGLGALGLIGLAMGIPKFGALLAHEIPIWLGRISYSLYLVHVPILYAVTQTIGSSWPALQTSLVVIALSLLVADLTARTIEFPFIKLGKRLAAKTEPAFA
jgi:peptidoglycan/LPS O-acetylase OafA/YrhL